MKLRKKMVLLYRGDYSCLTGKVAAIEETERDDGYVKVVIQNTLPSGETGTANVVFTTPETNQKNLDRIKKISVGSMVFVETESCDAFGVLVHGGTVKHNVFTVKGKNCLYRGIYNFPQKEPFPRQHVICGRTKTLRSWQKDGMFYKKTAFVCRTDKRYNVIAAASSPDALPEFDDNGTYAVVVAPTKEDKQEPGIEVAWYDKNFTAVKM